MNGSMTIRRTCAYGLLAVAVLVPMLPILMSYVVGLPPSHPTPGADFERLARVLGVTVTTHEPKPRLWWPPVVAVLGMLIASVLLVRRRNEPERWRVTALWSAGPGFCLTFAGIWEINHSIEYLVGFEMPRVMYVMPLIIVPLLYLVVVIVARELVLSAPPFELAASMLTFQMGMRETDWILCFGRDSLIVRPTDPVIGPAAGHGMSWADLVGVAAVSIPAPVSSAIAAGIALPCAAGEAVSVRDAGGRQWALPVTSARTIAELIEQARRHRYRRRIGVDPELRYRMTSIRSFRAVSLAMNFYLIFGAGGFIELGLVVTGAVEPIGLLGVLFFWGPLLYVLFLGRRSGLGRPSERPWWAVLLPPQLERALGLDAPWRGEVPRQYSDAPVDRRTVGPAPHSRRHSP
jgi:hypothetical protein